MNKLTVLILLFSFTFLIYNLNFDLVGSSDNLPARILPFNILSGNGIYLDRYVKFLTGTTYYLLKYQNHYISAYPTMMGVLSLPVYFPFYIYLNMNGLSNDETLFKTSFLLEKVSASVLASLSVCLIYLLFYRISGSKTSSLLFSLIFAFATQTFSISSQALWQHGGANLFMITSLIFYVQSLKIPSKKPLYFILSLLLAILAFWTRLNYFLYLMLILSFITWIDKKRILLYAEIALLGILALITYNLSFYNSIFGGYTQLSGMAGAGDFWTGFLGLVFSPSRGTLFYTPFFFFSLLSIFFLKKIIKTSFEKYIFLPIYLYFIMGAILNFYWGGWWGGWSWGNRLLTDIAVPVVILSYFFYRWENRKYIKIIFFTCVIYSVFTQVLGVFFYSKTNWESIPNDAYFHQERLWQINDSPILRSLKLGPNLIRIDRIVDRLKNK